MKTVTLEIPAQYVRSFGESEEEVRRNAKIELATAMYREEKWSTRKAGEFAGMNRWEFMDLLMSRDIPAPYSDRMLQQDLNYALEMGRTGALACPARRRAGRVERTAGS